MVIMIMPCSCQAAAKVRFPAIQATPAVARFARFIENAIFAPHTMRPDYPYKRFPDNRNSYIFLVLALAENSLH
ncbi:hypothetical protein [Paraflavitalea sp. CAU 1676]|uniref:hypothetical protein n=1 Tax=Paraflavitalea sp. CAU 1676 TaxID=3032598 RepID=UPI0023DCB5B1|nr:hypothetical protein [Paraflavitalea sp. CAU 1676]MDF2192773.1 hypothetical protein [Paraflavitalea sp. CAU 1676]